MSKTIEHEWQLELPAATTEQLLAALAARDRLFGQSISLEPEDDPESAVEVWLGTTELLDGKNFRLALFAEMTGPKDYIEAAKEAIEDLAGEQIEEAAAEAAAAELVVRRAAKDVVFKKVKEEDECPELIIPEWLAPEDDETEEPSAFRSFDTKGKPWPGKDLLEKHARLVLVPCKDEFLVYALPALESEDEH